MNHNQLKALIARLRRRYKRTPRPKCRLCGAAMSPGFMGEGRIEWYCDGEKGKWFGYQGPDKEERERHYNASQHIQTSNGDQDVLKLCRVAARLANQLDA